MNQNLGSDNYAPVGFYPIFNTEWRDEWDNVDEEWNEWTDDYEDSEEEDEHWDYGSTWIDSDDYEESYEVVDDDDDLEDNG